jgi:hypothetical protein
LRADAFQKNYAEVTDGDYLGEAMPLDYDKCVWDSKLRLHRSPHYSPKLTVKGMAYALKTVELRPATQR